jgi:hypothetical protein
MDVDLPAKLDEVIAKCLEKDRNLRYQHASEIRTDLQRLKRNTEFAPVSEITKAGIATRATKQWAVIALVAIALVALASTSYFYLHRTAKLTEKDTVVIADFANTTGDPVFDETLKTALNVSLRQSPFLNILSESEVAKTLQQMTRPVGTKLTPEVTRELGLRAGSKAYLVGTISTLGREYVLGLRAVDCQSGDTLVQEQVTAASKEKVLDALGEAASKIRGELGGITGYGSQV